MNQAKRLGKAFKELPIVAIYASPLLRARWTTEQIALYHDLKISFNEDLREKNFGDAEGQSWHTASWDRSGQVGSGRDAHFPNGESNNDVGRRSTNFINTHIVPWIKRYAGVEKRKAGHVVVVAHGIAITELIYAINLKGSQMTCPVKSGLSNTGWTRMMVEWRGQASGGNGTLNPFASTENDAVKPLLGQGVGPSDAGQVQESMTEPSVPDYLNFKSGPYSNTVDLVSDDDSIEPPTAKQSLAPPDDHLSTLFAGGATPTTPVDELADDWRGKQGTGEINVWTICVNSIDHLTGLKRQSGGIGSAPFDEKQTSLQKFLKSP